MPRSGGIYTLPQTAFQANTVISSAAMNSDLNDVANALTQSLAIDGQTVMTGSLPAWSGGDASSPSYTFGSARTSGFYNVGANVEVSVGGTAVASFTPSGVSNSGGIPVGVPVGTVVDFAGAAAPTGWLLCFGQSLNTSTYAALFAVINYTYGGSGVNFSAPDCRGLATFGKTNMGGSDVGNITVAGGNFDGTVLGGTGGRQDTSVLQTHLPALTLTTSIASGQGSHTHSANASSGIALVSGSQISTGGGGTLNPATLTINNNTLPAMTGTTPTGGSGTALPTLSNAIIFNKIIFAGA